MRYEKEGVLWDEFVMNYYNQHKNLHYIPRSSDCAAFPCRDEVLIMEMQAGEMMRAFRLLVLAGME